MKREIKVNYSCTQGLIEILGFMVIFDENQGVSDLSKFEFLCPIYVKIIKFLVCLFVCLFIQRSVQLQSDRHFCYGAYIQINLYHIQVHKHTWQRVLARKRVSRPVEEWSEAHF